MMRSSGSVDRQLRRRLAGSPVAVPVHVRLATVSFRSRSLQVELVRSAHEHY